MKNNSDHFAAAWKLKLLFDGDCPFYKREIAWMSQLNQNGYIASPDVNPNRYGLTQKEVMRVIHGVCHDDRIIKKVEVFTEAYRLLGLGWLVAPLSWPFVRGVANSAYEIFARYRIPFGNFLGARSCRGNSCSASKAHRHHGANFKVLLKRISKGVGFP